MIHKSVSIRLPCKYFILYDRKKKFGRILRFCHQDVKETYNSGEPFENF